MSGLLNIGQADLHPVPYIMGYQQYEKEYKKEILNNIQAMLDQQRDRNNSNIQVLDSIHGDLIDQDLPHGQTQIQNATYDSFPMNATGIADNSIGVGDSRLSSSNNPNSQMKYSANIRGMQKTVSKISTDTSKDMKKIHNKIYKDKIEELQRVSHRLEEMTRSREKEINQYTTITQVDIPYDGNQQTNETMQTTSNFLPRIKDDEQIDIDVPLMIADEQDELNTPFNPSRSFMTHELQ